MGKLKIAIVLILIFWCGSSVKIVKSGGSGQIVSPEIIKIDSTTKEIQVVTPDEVQRMENDRDRQMKNIKAEIALLTIRISKLESEVYP